MSKECSYCLNKYKDSVVGDPPNSAGGYINGFWFCKICIKHSFGKEAESKKIKILTNIAEERSTKDI
jgi:hypothetical protein